MYSSVALGTKLRERDIVLHADRRYPGLASVTRSRITLGQATTKEEAGNNGKSRGRERENFIGSSPKNSPKFPGREWENIATKFPQVLPP
jgi:hypothetical protein